MPVYLWEANTPEGDLRKGQVMASNEKEVRAKLRAQSISPIFVKKKGFELPAIRIPMVGGVPTKALVVFTRQFATMIDAGLPLIQCLELLSTQEPNKNLRRILCAIKADVESGATFADALRKHPRIFDELFVNLVAAGEVGGILDTIMNRLANYIEKNQKLMQQVKGALTYPLGILAVSVIVVLLLMWKVIPTFEGMFASFGGQLPAPTQFVIDLSDFFLQHYLLIIGGLVGSVFGFQAFYRSKKGRKLFDAFILKTPMFGPLVQKVAIAKFTRTLGTMVSSGVPILDALEIVAKSAGNKTVEAAVMYTRERVSEGRQMADPLMETKVFPQMVGQMISVGESAGAMDTMLNKIADFYEDEVDASVSSLTKMLEPVMMVFLGGIVGGMLISMYLPIFEMAGNVQGG